MTHEGPAQEQPPAASDQILVVDDTPANLRLLSQILQEHGYRVRAVTNGPRALESAQASPPSLVLLDIRMPGMSGFEVCERLKADARTRDVPVIFISALDAVEDKVRAFHMGGVDYITKPFQIGEVLARTETHLALRRLQEQLRERNRRYERELALAGQIQASFLPPVPDIPGWQIAARLTPSRETSGDFYDFVPLPGGRWGIVVGDVADKGAGAALFMALSWSLIRTYLVEHLSAPARALELVNRRILQDTLTTEFVTAFLGVLDPATSTLAYGNAGHCPALLVRAGGDATWLARTGMALGVVEESAWDERRVSFQAGDLLALYTDGVTEALGPQGELFRPQRLQSAVLQYMRAGPVEILERVLADVRAFTQDTRLQDDIALIVLKKS
jgi:sigma-B regulation protein RsbU (phosphoserine phosphatase)